MLIALSSQVFLRRLLLRTSFYTKRAWSTSTNKSALDFNYIKYPTKVPLKPVLSNAIKSEKVNIDKETIELLMRLSLVNLSDE